MIRVCSPALCRSCASPLERGDFVLCAPCTRDLVGAVVAREVIAEVDAELAAEDAALFGEGT